MIALAFLLLQGFLWLSHLAEISLKVLGSLGCAYFGMTKTKKQPKRKKDTEDSEEIAEPKLVDNPETALNLTVDTIASGIRQHVPLAASTSNTLSINWELTRGLSDQGTKEWFLAYHWKTGDWDSGYGIAFVSPSSRKVEINDSEGDPIVRFYFEDLPDDPSCLIDAETAKMVVHAPTVERLDEIYQDLLKHLRSGLDLKHENQYVFLTLYIIGTYIFEACSAFPYLSVKGVKRSGKSRLGEMLEHLCYHAKTVSGISGATIYRHSHLNRGSLIIDSNRLHKQLHKEPAMSDFIREGYKPKKVIRQEKSGSGKFKSKGYEAYCPKAFLTIGGLDDVLEDRAFKIVMVRSNKQEVTNQEPSSLRKSGKDLQKRLYLWKFTEGFLYDEIQVPKIDGIHGRHWELAKPLFWLAQQISNDVVVDLEDFLKQQIGVEAEIAADDLNVKLLCIAKELISEMRTEEFKLAESSKLRISVSEFKTRCDDLGIANWDGMLLPSGLIGKRLSILGFEQKRNSKGAGYLFSDKEVNDLLQTYSVLDLPTLPSSLTQPTSENVGSASNVDSVSHPDHIERESLSEISEWIKSMQVFTLEDLLNRFPGRNKDDFQKIIDQCLAQGTIIEFQSGKYRPNVVSVSGTSEEPLCKSCHENPIHNKDLCRHCLLQAQLPNIRNDESDNGGSED
ncbi:MAG: hypothetical protein ACXACI_01950 [Candidatus Hodarchaeales archaeon]|jgi:hypothetical protein